MKRWLFKSVIYSFLAAIFVGFSMLGYEIHALLKKPMNVAPDSSMMVTIDKNTSASLFVNQLKSRHLIRAPRLFLALIRLQGLAHQLKAGIYQIKPGESAQQLLKHIIAGHVLTGTFRIIEGSNINQVKANIERAEFLKYNPDDWYFIQANHSNPEGLLLADTYYYNAGSDSKHLLKLANKNLLQVLQDAWQKRSTGLPYRTPYELLIAASILEKETALPVEKKIIAGVIVNRLKKNMRLQMDPTVIYGLGSSYQGKLHHNDLNIDSLYNTYRYHGLPPSPIAMVGKEAIEAAAQPQDSNYLYFVARGDGSHQFSATYEEQKRAILRYQGKKSL